MARITLASSLCLILLAKFAHAAPAQMSVTEWAQGIIQEATANGVSYNVARDTMARFLPDNRVIRLDHRQPEHTISFATYSKYILSRGTIARGIKLIDQNDESLEKISQHYGVPASVIVALWGVESGYGSSTGHFNMVDAIGTLALEGRRATFFRKELIALLQIIDKEQIPASSLQGSWAGAMGQCQFMPSTYLQYAVDYDHDGRRDIWNNRKDTFASIANYLTAIGWKRGQTWGREVRLKQPVQKSMVGLTTSQNLAAWSKMGIVKLNKSPLPNSPFNASLIQPDGPHGRSFLVYDNFRALMRWNRSTYFATSIGLLSDRLTQ